MSHAAGQFPCKLHNLHIILLLITCVQGPQPKVTRKTTSDIAEHVKRAALMTMMTVKELQKAVGRTKTAHLMSSCVSQSGDCDEYL
jgi:hypothetical protein